MSRAVRIAAAGLVTAAALWLSFRKIAWPDLGASLGRIRPVWIAAAVVNSLLGVVILGARWRILLRPKADVSAAELFRMNILGQYANIVMPARTGEAVRIYLGSRHPNLAPAYVLGTLGAEKLLDLFIFAGLWLSVPFLFVVRQAGPGLGLSAAFFAASAAAFAFIAFRPAIVFKAIRLLTKLLPESLGGKVRRWGEQAVEAFGPLRVPKVVLSILLWTIVLVLNQAVTNEFAFRASGLALPPQAALLVLLALQAGALPPSVPGKLGTFEYAVILALSLFAVPRGAALSCAVALHVVVYLPKIILGAVFMSVRRGVPRPGNRGADESS